MKQAEKDGKQAEAGNTLENYDSEMNSAAQKSQEAKEASKKEESGDFGDGHFGSRVFRWRGKTAGGKSSSG